MTLPARAERPEISVVIPCLNEVENVEAISEAAGRILQRCNVSYEILFIDNGSADGTKDIIRSLCHNDGRIKAIFNTRNFGQMRSPTHGIYQATAYGAVIGLCADFEDPPELLEQFIALWRGGASIVLGVRKSQKAPMLLRLMRSVGYGFFERFGDYRVIPNATGFGLYDRRVVDCLKSWRDPEPFFRGMLVESGYPLQTLEYDRSARAGGKSKNNFISLLGFAISGVLSSSKRLLRLPIYTSILFLILMTVTFSAAIVMMFVGKDARLILLLVVMQFMFAITCLFLGLIGEQVRILLEMSRNMPLVIERERLNI